jgi:hypothetical protein
MERASPVNTPLLERGCRELPAPVERGHAKGRCARPAIWDLKRAADNVEQVTSLGRVVSEVREARGLAFTTSIECEWTAWGTYVSTLTCV